MDYLLLLSTILAGALTVLFLRLERHGYIKLFNAFTGAYLLCVTFLHLLPELYSHDAALGHHGLIGALILGGFFLQIILDSISMGVEHGHTHHLHGGVPWGVIIGLCLHAFVEATALGSAGQHHDPASRRMLLTSIVVHNYPVSIALLVMLLHAGLPRGRALGFLALFAAMGPLGMFLSAHTDLASHTRELTAVVIGIFMHISTTILFESSDTHRFNLAKIAAILIGMGVGVLTVMLH
ncbi:MAG: ZIP family metal transporter [Verrucomicrobia bacterium]|nr:ZIP family metal transporter [Verrucomicrobiota bacterium]